MAGEEFELIETLRATEGKNPGEAIASYGRSIVFLPRGVRPGQEVRLKLIELEKKDSRGRTMYRGIPAPDIEGEKWKDNGDGTASRVTIVTNWLLQESEVRVMETRPLEKREGHPLTQSHFHVVWGQDLASSVVEDRHIRIIPLEEEKVEGGQVVWRRTGERQEPMTPIAYPVEKIEDRGYGSWHQNRFQKVYSGTDEVRIWVWYAKPDSHGLQGHEVVAPWAEMPNWWRQEQETRYPVCSCGRQRYDVQNSDGYAKCEKCREEEHCVRCGKQARVSCLNGRLVCSACEMYEKQEQLIAQHLPREYREQIAQEARKLLAGQALEAELGLAVLKAGLGQVNSYTQDRILNQWKGYQWYYFTDEGVFGTKLAPAALQILQFLSQASGNGLVEMVGWLVTGPKVGSSDYYLRTQVNGETGVKPSITEDQLRQIVEKLVAGQPVLADWLRGSEQKLQAELTKLREKWDATPG